MSDAEFRSCITGILLGVATILFVMLLAAMAQAAVITGRFPEESEDCRRPGMEDGIAWINPKSSGMDGMDKIQDQNAGRIDIFSRVKRSDGRGENWCYHEIERPKKKIAASIEWFPLAKKNCHCTHDPRMGHSIEDCKAITCDVLYIGPKDGQAVYKIVRGRE
jgi:hypothetical protein